LSWLQGAGLGEKICCELRLRIINGQIKAGTKLSENQIAAEFGTSRSPVRDAFKILDGEGLIRLERMGAVVLGLKPKDLEELHDVRFLIEQFVMNKVIQLPTEELVVELRHILDKMKLASMHQDAVEFSYQDLQFHEAIILKADHSRILRLWRTIRHIVLTALLVATEKRFLSSAEDIGPLVEKHRCFVTALASQNRDLIKKALDDHFADVRVTVNQAVSFPDQ
jgi:GntR family transcriptional regulator of gluconate operon